MIDVKVEGEEWSREDLALGLDEPHLNGTP